MLLLLGVVRFAFKRVRVRSGRSTGIWSMGHRFRFYVVPYTVEWRVEYACVAYVPCVVLGVARIIRISYNYNHILDSPKPKSTSTSMRTHGSGRLEVMHRIHIAYII